jgi:hypothetical protein
MSPYLMHQKLKTRKNYLLLRPYPSGFSDLAPAEAPFTSTLSEAHLRSTTVLNPPIANVTNQAAIIPSKKNLFIIKNIPLRLL